MTTSTIAYGGAASQVADLTVPAGDGPFPVVVLVHGGFWATDYGRDIVLPLAADLVGRGAATWNVEYRRTRGDGGGWPETFADVAAGVDHLAVIADPRLDLDHVALVGHSAGGHLVLWLAARSLLPPHAPGASPRVTPAAVVAQAPITDLATALDRRVGGRSVLRLMGGTPDEVDDDRYALASPIALLPTRVRTTLVHGAHDELVPLAQSTDHVAAARRAGDAVTLVTTDGDHYGHLDPASPEWAAALDALGGLLSR